MGGGREKGKKESPGRDAGFPKVQVSHVVVLVPFKRPQVRKKGKKAKKEGEQLSLGGGKGT